MSKKEGYAHPEMLAETEWLGEHLDDPELRIVDVGPADGYKRAHIKNAINFPREYFKDPKNQLHVTPPEQFATLMGSVGIGNDNQVVAYDEWGGLYAARLWWVLNLYGHTKVQVLNGGFTKWLKEGRAAVAGSVASYYLTLPEPSYPKATFIPKINPDVYSSCDYLKEHCNKSDVVTVDVRSDGEYYGTNPRHNKRPGHLPGTVHIEWMNCVTPDEFRVFKPPGELLQMFQEAGVTRDKEVITY